MYVDEWIVVSVVATVGLAFGSFATAISYRLPRGQQFLTGRSHCTSCNHDLGLLDLFPILSWILLRGKCRYCKVEFSTSYPITEIALSAMFVIVYLKTGLTLEFLTLASLSVCIIILTVIDFEHYIIPDQINIAMLLIGIFHQIITGSSWEHIIFGPLTGVGIGFLLRWMMFAWKKKEGLGMGDVKFLAVVGIFLHAEILSTFFFMSGMIGIATALLWKLLGKGERFPFGPALAMSLFICIVAPELHEWWQSYITGLIVQ